MRARGGVVDRLLWGLAAASACGIVIVSLTPRQPGAQLGFSDKALHAAAYAIVTLAFLLAGVWRPGRGGGAWPAGAAGVVAGALALGLVLEVLQASIGRSAEIADAVANALGVLSGLALWAALQRSRPTT